MFGYGFSCPDCGQLKRWGIRASFPVQKRCTGHGWAHIGLRQVKSKGASLAGGASQLNLTSQQTSQFAADRQPQPGPAVLAAGAGICLLESLEDDALLVRRNSDASISDFEGHN